MILVEHFVSIGICIRTQQQGMLSFNHFFVMYTNSFLWFYTSANAILLCLLVLIVLFLITYILVHSIFPFIYCIYYIIRVPIETAFMHVVVHLYKCCSCVNRILLQTFKSAECIL